MRSMEAGTESQEATLGKQNEPNSNCKGYEMKQPRGQSDKRQFIVSDFCPPPVHHYQVEDGRV